MKSPNADISVIAQEIIRYLEGHMNAADSVDGIAKWWLSRQRYEETLERVQQALDMLVSKGVLKRSITASGNTVYSRSTTENNDGF